MLPNCHETGWVEQPSFAATDLIATALIPDSSSSSYAASSIISLVICVFLPMVILYL